MRTDELIRDPVFQLNLLLWMAREQPQSGYRVRPLFHQLGYRIIYIEQPFAFPVETANAIGNVSLDISSKPEPEMILGRDSDYKALYFEAKSNSFSPDSSTAKQARGHLLACGPAFAESLSPLEACLLCYVTPGDKCDMMRECLQTLSVQLEQEGLSPGRFSSHGVSVQGSELIYSWDTEFMSYASLSEPCVAVMSDLTEETNPSPLVLLFTDEDHHDPTMQDFYRRVVIEQLRATLLCELHAHPLGALYTRTTSQLLDVTSGDLFKYYGRARGASLNRLVRQNIFKRIEEHWKDRQPGIQVVNDELQITWHVSGEKEQFLSWLEDKRTRFGTGKAVQEQEQDQVPKAQLTLDLVMPGVEQSDVAD